MVFCSSTPSTLMQCPSSKSSKPFHDPSSQLPLTYLSLAVICISFLSIMSILQEMFPESYMLSNKMPKSSGSESRQVKSTGGDKWLPATIVGYLGGGYWTSSPQVEPRKQKLSCSVPVPPQNWGVSKKRGGLKWSRAIWPLPHPPMSSAHLLPVENLSQKISLIREVR